MSLRLSWINLFDAPPRVWPPPCDAAGFAECVNYAERRDPFGHAVHVGLGCVYLFSAGLATATESIAFALLISCTVLRLPNLWRGLMPLFAAPIVWALVAFAAWSALSGMWATDSAAWRDAQSGFRGLLLIPALYPIRSAWRALLGSLIAGMSLQGAVQLLQQLGLVNTRAHRTDVRFSGLHSDPAQVSLFAAVAFVIALGWLSAARSFAERAALVIGASLLAISIAIAAGRAAVLGLAIAVPLLAIFLVLFNRLSLQRLAIATVFFVGAVAVVGGGILATGGQGLRRQAGDLTAIGNASTSTGARFLWWRASIDAAMAHPIAGIGAGGSREMLERDPNVRNAIAAHPDVPPDAFIVAHPHSMYLQTAAELGAIGVVCLAVVCIVTVRAAWRAAAESPVKTAIAAALVVWAIGAGFSSLHVTGRTASLACVLLALSTLPSRHRAEPPCAAVV